jgi:HK97 family phage major capsid protein
MTKEQYLNQRKQLLNEAKGFLDAGDIEKFNAKKKEVEDLDAKYEAAATAQANLAALEGACVVPMDMQNLAAAGQPAASASTEDRFDSVEYQTAFMNFSCRREPMPEKFRNEAAVTTSSDVGAVIPTTWGKEIIRNLKERGVIFKQLRHMNIKGGVELPILHLMPVATWVGEGASDEQKLEAKKTISFKYYGLECKIAQSILVSVVTLDAFQELFVELATEAVIAAVELGVFKGSGVKQMLGVCNDPRVTNVVEMTAEDVSKWAQWKKKFFAKIKKRYKGGKLYMAQGTFESYVDGMVDQNGQPVARTNYGISGDPTYRFGGKDVETVEEDILSDFETAATGEVFAVYMNMKDYVFNSNMAMSVVQWTDHDTNKKKTKVMLICDGKAADTNGIILLKKA